MVAVRWRWSDHAYSVYSFYAIHVVRLQDSNIRSNQSQNGNGSRGTKVSIYNISRHIMCLSVYIFYMHIFSMAHLLSKLRIDYSSLTMLQGMNQKPAQSTIDFHNKLLIGFQETIHNDCFVPQTEAETLQEKTYRQLRLRELLIEHSTTASLIVMSLPMPRQV